MDTSGRYDYLTLKLDPSDGTTVWEKRYDYAGYDDAAVAIAFDEYQNPVITGASKPDSLTSDFATLKYRNTSGFQQSENRVDNPGLSFEFPTAITRDTAGYFYVAGIADTSGLNRDIQVVKLDTALNLIWSVFYDGSGKEDGANSIQVAGNGKVMVTGFSRNNNSQKELLVLAYNANGSLAWEQRRRPVNSQQQVEGKKSVLSPDGSIYVAGEIKTGGLSEIVVLKYENDGSLAWEAGHTTNPGESNKPVGIGLGLDQSIFVFGTTITPTLTKYYNLRFREFKRDTTVEVDTVSGSKYRRVEVIVKFDPDEDIHDHVNNLDIKFEEPSYFLTGAAIDSLEQRIDLDRATLVRIFTELKTTHTSTTSRMGETIPIPDFWAAFILILPEADHVDSTIQQLNTFFPLVEYAHRNYIVELLCVPDDPHYETFQHSLHPTGQFNDTMDINIEPVWCDFEVYGEPFVKVGVFDSGTFWSHTDFGYDGFDQGSSVVKGGFETETKADLFTLLNPDPHEDSHGTAVAGIIGAVRDNGEGIAGIAGGNDNASSGGNGVSLYGIKIKSFSNQNNAGLASLSEAIMTTSMAAGTSPNAYGLHLMNNSWRIVQANNLYTIENIQLLSDVIHQANRSKVIFTAASGNENPPLGTYYPSNYDYDWVLCVGGSGYDGKYAFPATQGLNVDLIAPSESYMVRSLNKSNGYQFTPFGTSFGTPHVTATAALLLNYYNSPGPSSVYSNLAPEDVEFILNGTATDVGSTGYDISNANGRLNAGAAFEYVKKPERNIRHFGTTEYPSEKTYALVSEDVQIQFSETYKNAAGEIFQQGTIYKADVYKITAVVEHDLEPNDSILASWPRHSSSTTFRSILSNSQLIPHEKVTLVSVNQSSATLEGYVYKVKKPQSGILVGWAPFNVTDLEQKADLEYTLLTLTEEPTGNEERSLLDLIISPNPSNGSISIELELPGQSLVCYDIYDARGTLLKSSPDDIHETGFVIYQQSLEHLPAGLYFLKVNTAFGSITKTISKQ